MIKFVLGKFGNTWTVDSIELQSKNGTTVSYGKGTDWSFGSNVDEIAGCFAMLLLRSVRNENVVVTVMNEGNETKIAQSVFETLRDQAKIPWVQNIFKDTALNDGSKKFEPLKEYIRKGGSKKNATIRFPISGTPPIQFIIGGQIATPRQLSTYLMEKFEIDIMPPVGVRHIFETSSLVGRKVELKILNKWIRDHRMISITGAPGIGKTRIIEQLAIKKRTSFNGNISFVELANCRDHQALESKLISTLGIRIIPEIQLIENIAEHIGKTNTLLFFDNCEQIKSECAEVIQGLLKLCKNLTIVASSRMPLGILGEQNFQVDNLTYPDKNESYSATWKKHDAVVLFAERARSSKHNFRLTKANTILVAEICRRLEGIPLAIEIAASRLRLMNLQELHSRLLHSFDSIKDVEWHGPPDRRTLWKTFEWSLSLIEDKRVHQDFAYLSIFPESWNLMFAEDIISIDINEKYLVTKSIFNLVDASLIKFVPELNRYKYLQPIREFASERTDNNFHKIQENFFKFMKLEVIQNEQTRSDYWVYDVIEEYENIEAALYYAYSKNDVKGVIDMILYLAEYWENQGNLESGLRFFSMFFMLAEKEPASTNIAYISLWYSKLLIRSKRYEEAYEKLLIAHEIFSKRANLIIELIDTLLLLSQIYRHHKNYDLVLENLRYCEALVLFSEDYDVHIRFSYEKAQYAKEIYDKNLYSETMKDLIKFGVSYPGNEYTLLAKFDNCRDGIRYNELMNSVVNLVFIILQFKENFIYNSYVIQICELASIFSYRAGKNKYAKKFLASSLTIRQQLGWPELDENEVQEFMDLAGQDKLTLPSIQTSWSIIDSEKIVDEIYDLTEELNEIFSE